MSIELSIVIVTHETSSLMLEECVSAAWRSAGRAALRTEIVIVDNGASTLRPRRLDSFTVRWIENDANVGFARAANRGVGCAYGRVVLLLNPDASLEIDAISRLSARLQEPGRRLVSPWLIKGDRVQVDAYLQWWYSSQRLKRRGKYRKALVAQYERGCAFIKVERLCGAALLGRHEDLERFGPFDESFFLYGEDVDLSLRASAAGYSLEVVPSAIAHHAAASSQQTHGALVEQARVDAALRLLQKHRGVVARHAGAAELAVISLLGLAQVRRTSSVSRRNRLARLSEIWRWERGRSPANRFSPPSVLRGSPC